MTTIFHALSLVLAAAAGQERTAVLPDTAPPQVTLTGRFAGEGGGPAAGICYSAGVEYDGEPLCRLAGASDAQGSFRIELPFPAGEHLNDTSKLRCFVEVEEVGFQRSRQLAFFSGGDGEIKIRETIGLRPGFTARLRIVDRTGAPVDAATSVHVFEHDPQRWSDGEDYRWREPGRKPRTQPAGPKGTFLVHASVPTNACFLARASGIGAGYLADVWLDPATADRTISIELRGDGVLRGSLRDPDGRPLAGFHLDAWPAELVAEDDLPEAIVHRRSALESRGGLCTDRVMTDEHGRFEFRGLQPGSYFIQDARGNDDPLRSRIERRTFAADAREIDLAVLDHRLLVELLDERGQRFTESGLYCVKLPEAVEDDTFPPTDGRRLLEPGLWSLQVEPGQRYAVGWFGSRRTLVEREVRIEPDTYTTKVQLDLGPERNPAHLTFEVLDAAGSPFQPLAFQNLRVALCSARTGKELIVADDRYYTRPPYDVPPGEYVVRATPGYERLLCGIAAPPRQRYGPAEERVSLVEGESRTVRLIPWTGGRVRLFLDLPDDVRDPRLIRPPGVSDRDDWPRRNALFALAENDPSGRVEELGIDGAALLSVPFYFGDDSPAASERILPGTSAVSYTLFSPGEHVLRIEAPGFETETVRVLVSSDRITDARVKLRNRER